MSINTFIHFIHYFYTLSTNYAMPFIVIKFNLIKYCINKALEGAGNFGSILGILGFQEQNRILSIAIWEQKTVVMPK